MGPFAILPIGWHLLHHTHHGNEDNSFCLPNLTGMRARKSGNGWCCWWLLPTRIPIQHCIARLIQNYIPLPTPQILELPAPQMGFCVSPSALLFAPNLGSWRLSSALFPAAALPPVLMFLLYPSFCGGRRTPQRTIDRITFRNGVRRIASVSTMTRQSSFWPV